MGEHITAAEARALLAGLSTPWRAVERTGGIHRGAVVDSGGEVIAECYCTAYDGHGSQVAAAVAALPQVAAALEHAEAERARLARVLAVERGDIGQAPDRWFCAYAVDSWSRHVGDRMIIVQRFARAPGVTVWERRGIRRSDPAHREWPTALEAMEAIDAEVSHG